MTVTVTNRRHEADAGAGGFLPGGALGAFPVGGVAGGLVAALGAAQGGAERGGVDFALDDAGGLRRRAAAGRAG